MLCHSSSRLSVVCVILQLQKFKTTVLVFRAKTHHCSSYKNLFLKSRPKLGKTFFWRVSYNSFAIQKYVSTKRSRCLGFLKMSAKGDEREKGVGDDSPRTAISFAHERPVRLLRADLQYCTEPQIFFRRRAANLQQRTALRSHGRFRVKDLSPVIMQPYGCSRPNRLHKSCTFVFAVYSVPAVNSETKPKLVRQFPSAVVSSMSAEKIKGLVH